MSDLSPYWIKVKAGLFALIGVSSVTLLWLERPTLKVAFLLFAAIWSFARLYYFAFYVVEKYLDPNFRYAGLLHALRTWRQRSAEETSKRSP